MSTAPLSPAAKRNVEAIALVEQQLHGRRSRVERVGDWVAGFFGSVWFIAAHAALFAAWILYNVRAVPWAVPFDPYPFPFLGFAVGVEFFFLTTFVLMNQDLQSKRQERWGHLTLQVCLLAEQGEAANAQTLALICRHLGIEEPAAGGEAAGLPQATPVTALVEEIEKVREAGEALAEEAGKVREAGAELAAEMQKTTEVGADLVGEMRKTVKAGEELVGQLQKARGEEGGPQ